MDDPEGFCGRREGAGAVSPRNRRTSFCKYTGEYSYSDVSLSGERVVVWGCWELLLPPLTPRIGVVVEVVVLDTYRRLET